MPIEITMPKLSDTMTDGTLVKWLKHENDKVNPGDIIAEVETDKATQELETFEAGTVARIVIPEGAKVPVGGLIVVIARPGEDVAQVSAGVNMPAGSAAAVAPKASSPAAIPGAELAGPAEEIPADTGAPVAVEDHLEGAEQIRRIGKVRVSPVARKMAEELGLDVALIPGTGPDGRVIKRDVLTAAARPRRTAPAPAGVPAAPMAGGEGLASKRIALSNMRQTIARRLVQAKQTIPHFYVSIDVVMDKLLDMRQDLNAQIAPEKVTVTDFVARAVVVALTRVPAMNASFAETEIIRHGNVDLGIAVALEDGLVVPVLRGAQHKSLRVLSNEIKALSAGAKAGKLKINQITGSTFTISNLGMYGVKEFAAIINPPESAILAVGGTAARPIVRDGQVVPAQVMTLTLSADHRVVDGALGAKFLAELKTILESPLALVL